MYQELWSTFCHAFNLEVFKINVDPILPLLRGSWILYLCNNTFHTGICHCSDFLKFRHPSHTLDKQNRCQYTGREATNWQGGRRRIAQITEDRKPEPIGKL